MKIVFRVDASVKIGTGHLVRCLTLARALRDNGGECVFISRDHEGSLNTLIQTQGFMANVLPQQKHKYTIADQLVPANADLLGVSWLADAKETVEALGDDLVDWLIIDHYALDKSWESHIRPYTKKLMVIDDLADREHDCDLLLDPNLTTDFRTRYNHLVPDKCIQLLGLEYAMLQSQYAEMRLSAQPRTGPVRRLIVYFGGSDSYNLTELTISAFLKLKRDDLKLDVVLGRNSKNAATVRSKISGHANISLYEDVPSLAPLMVKADLAIGAGGATTWERCCMGLPSIVITVAQNQIPIADALSTQGLIFLIGDCGSVTEDSLSKAIKNNLSGHGLGAWSKNCFDLVDGKGVGRVASIVTLGPKKRLRLRPAKLEDETLLLGWANDSQTRSSSFNTSLICPKSHRIWLYSRLKNISCYRLYIAETQDGLPIGQVRFELGESNDWEIHYSLWVGARGMGFGAKMVSLALEQLRETNPLGKVIGYVKLSNIPSMRIFESLGFLGFQEDTRVVYSLALNKKRHKTPKIRGH